MKRIFNIFNFILACIAIQSAYGQKLLKNVTLIDGTGKNPQGQVDILIKGDKIAAISETGKDYPRNVKVIDLTGKTIMPMLINTHGHVGLLKGTKTSAVNYTKENVVAQLEKYERYGVGTVMSLGTDRESVFNLRDLSRAGQLPGAYLFTAGYGFTTKGGGPNTEGGPDLLFRPTNAEEAAKNVQELAKLKPDIIKMWVDNFGTDAEKIKPEVYQSIIKEAHKHKIKAASHLYYIEDARSLAKADVDVFAHSIRDKEVDTDLIQLMKAKGIVYIPTLTLDKFAYSYAERPEWLNDDFFKGSLEPGVLEMIDNDEYRTKTRNAANYQRNVKAFEMAMKNLKTLYDAGVKIALGTDSGAQPIRTQGFAEHLELELLTQAGLTPLQAIVVATKNGAETLGIIKQRGTLEVGKKADFIVLSANPLKDIKATRQIKSVWKNGLLANQGPFSNK